MRWTTRPDQPDAKYPTTRWRLLLGRVIGLARSWCALRAIRVAMDLLGWSLVVDDALGTGVSCVLLWCIRVIGRSLSSIGSGLVLLLSPLRLWLLLLGDESLGLAGRDRSGSGNTRGLLDITAVLGPFQAEEVGDVGEGGDEEKQRDGTEAGDS